MLHFELYCIRFNCIVTFTHVFHPAFNLPFCILFKVLLTIFRSRFLSSTISIQELNIEAATRIFMRISARLTLNLFQAISLTASDQPKNAPAITRFCILAATLIIMILLRLSSSTISFQDRSALLSLPLNNRFRIRIIRFL